MAGTCHNLFISTNKFPPTEPRESLTAWKENLPPTWRESAPQVTVVRLRPLGAMSECHIWRGDQVLAQALTLSCLPWYQVGITPPGVHPKTCPWYSKDQAGPPGKLEWPNTPPPPILKVEYPEFWVRNERNPHFLKSPDSATPFPDCDLTNHYPTRNKTKKSVVNQNTWASTGKHQISIKGLKGQKDVEPSRRIT